MNKAVEKTTKNEIAELAVIIEHNPGAVLEMFPDGSGWGLYKEATPEKDMSDEQMDAWMDENCLAYGDEYAMESPDFGFTNAILMEALALAIGITMKAN